MPFERSPWSERGAPWTPSTPFTPSHHAPIDVKNVLDEAEEQQPEAKRVAVGPETVDDGDDDDEGVLETRFFDAQREKIKQQDARIQTLEAQLDEATTKIEAMILAGFRVIHASEDVQPVIVASVASVKTVTTPRRAAVKSRVKGGGASDTDLEADKRTNNLLLAAARTAATGQAVAMEIEERSITSQGFVEVRVGAATVHEGNAKLAVAYNVIQQADKRWAHAGPEKDNILENVSSVPLPDTVPGHDKNPGIALVANYHPEERKAPIETSTYPHLTMSRRSPPGVTVEYVGETQLGLSGYNIFIPAPHEGVSSWRLAETIPAKGNVRGYSVHEVGGIYFMARRSTAPSNKTKLGSPPFLMHAILLVGNVINVTMKRERSKRKGRRRWRCRRRCRRRRMAPRRAEMTQWRSPKNDRRVSWRGCAGACACLSLRESGAWRRGLRLHTQHTTHK